MDAQDIAGYLAAADAAGQEPRLRAVVLLPRRAGGSRPWDCLVEDGRWYVVKCLGNDQDRRLGPPPKVLPTELLCARLGQLFRPPLCPEPAVVEVPAEVAATALHPRTRRRQQARPCPGPAFGSRRIDRAVELKEDRGAALRGVPAAELARLAVFQTWLRGVDVSALVGPDGRLWSVDHGFYLTGPSWDTARLARPGPVRLKLPSCLPAPERLADPALFAPALEELASIPEEAIVRAFGGLPAEWGVPLGLRAEVAAGILRRRAAVARAVKAFCRSRRGP